MMNSFFDRSGPPEYVYEEDGNVEQEEVVNNSVEVPEDPVQPEVVEETPAKREPRGKSVGGGDYVFRGDF